AAGGMPAAGRLPGGSAGIIKKFAMTDFLHAGGGCRRQSAVCGRIHAEQLQKRRNYETDLVEGKCNLSDLSPEFLRQQWRRNWGPAGDYRKNWLFKGTWDRCCLAVSGLSVAQR